MQTEKQKITQALDTFSDKTATSEDRQQVLPILTNTKFLPKNAVHEQIVQG